ncbi:hypothetical protein BJ875DRAFT_527050 [Amylocarpus encephaloides]|uniref:Uncharacterized protein n=1 Tax=Amylocarpus encephaloides TaxID=45428 RepID=A0A9P7YTK0_9HELO|nr:hypothetical protein BJ875DRAFT_527050 [Amylocarpus encephaloides]
MAWARVLVDLHTQLSVAQIELRTAKAGLATANSKAMEEQVDLVHLPGDAAPYERQRRDVEIKASKVAALQASRHLEDAEQKLASANAEVDAAVLAVTRSIALAQAEMFKENWDSEQKARPYTKLSISRDAENVVMGYLVTDCEPRVPFRMRGSMAKNTIPRHRKAGARVMCRVENQLTGISFHYVDIENIVVTPPLTGKVSPSPLENIRLTKSIEKVHPEAIIAWDAAELARIQKYNRGGYVHDAQRALHFWCDVGSYDKVPGEPFKPKPIKLYQHWLTGILEELVDF